jgi:hypothetical protein
LRVGGLVGLLLAGGEPGEDENFDEKLESQEFRRPVPGDGDPALAIPKCNVEIFSEETLLEKPGL